MAIYHLSVQVISRGQGRSCVAAAAYRAGEKLEDVRQGLIQDYTRRHDVRETWIQAPEGGPAWVTDRQALWTAVDAAEKRKDARTAREVNVALPRELTPEQQREAVQEFVQAAFIERGMVADVALHEGHDAHEPNPHAHILLTTRTLTPEGFGAKNRDWNAKELLVTWRTQWEITCNEALEEAKQTARIDARSLADQGVTDRLPTVHEGVAVRQMERRGIPTDRGNVNRAVRAHQAVVVDLAVVREDRQALDRVHQRMEVADRWRMQAGWPQVVRQRLHGWEEQAGRVLTREDVTQWVQEAQVEAVQAQATEQEALRAIQRPNALQATHDRLTAAVEQARQAHTQLQQEYQGFGGWWNRWRNSSTYHALQARVMQGYQAEAQLMALQAPLLQQQQQMAQARAAYEQARAARQAVEAKLTRWQAVLNQPSTLEEHAAKQTIQQSAPQRQVPPQPLSPTVSVWVPNVAVPARRVSKEPEQDRGRSR